MKCEVKNSFFILYTSYFILFLVVLILSIVFFYNRVPWGKDTVLSYYPHSVEMARAYDAGEFPLWQPKGGFGMPAHAESQGGYLSPIHLISYLLSEPYHVYNIKISLIATFGFFFLFLYLKELGISGLHSVSASLVYIFGGFWVNHSDIIPIIENLMYLPAILFFNHRQLKSPRFLWTIGTGACFASAIMGGHFQMVAITGYVSMAYIVYNSSRGATCCSPTLSSFGKMGEQVFLLLLAISIALFLTAAQWVPTLELMSRASRPVESWFVQSYSTFPPLLMTLFLPDYFGFTASARVGGFTPTGFLGPGAFWENTCFIGVTVLFIGFIAHYRDSAGGEKSDGRRFFKWCFFISLLLSLGKYTPLGWVLAHVPPLNFFRIPARFFGVASLSSCVLFAFSLYDLSAAKKSFTARQALVPALIIGALVIGGAIGGSLALASPQLRGDLAQLLAHAQPSSRADECVYFLEKLRDNVSPFNPTNSFGIAIYLIILSVLFLFSRGRISGRIATAIFMLLSGVEIFNFALSHTAWIEPGKLAESPVSVNRIERDSGTSGRIYSDPPYYNPSFNPKELIPASMNILYGLETCEYRGSLFTKRMEKVMKLLKETFHEMNDSDGPDRSGVFAAFGVTHLLSSIPLLNTNGLSLLDGGPAFIWRVKAALPRIFLADDIYIAESSDEIFSVMTQQPSSSARALLEIRGHKTNSAAELGIVSPNFTGKGKITREADKREFIRLKVESEKQTVLVMNDQYFPGWTAAVDGREQRIYRANYLFRAVMVPAGAHIVTFVYHPVSFRMGLWFGVTSLLFPTVIVVFRRITAFK